ncbi:MAG: hypothetical protein AB7V39_13930, partial [Nitrospiraceae bacterium]
LDASITASDQGARRPGASAALAEPLRGVSEKMVPQEGIEPPTHALRIQSYHPSETASIT